MQSRMYLFFFLIKVFGHILPRIFESSIRLCQIMPINFWVLVHVDIELKTYLPYVDNHGHLTDHLPTSSCPRSLWTTPSLPFVYQQIFRESKGNNELQRSSFVKKNQVTRVLQNRSQKWKIKRLTARALFSLVSMLIKSHWMTGTAAFLFSANFLTDDMCAWKSNEQHLPPFFYKRAPLHHMHFQAVFLRSRS